MSIIYFLILIGVLVFVHEFGHFIVARFFDVKVLRFSIGFGPTILSWQGKETEYVICAFPLGGYVQMDGADEETAEEVPEEERHRTLMAKPIWQRSLVILAGPVANILLPILIFFTFYVGQTETFPSVVGQVFPETPAAEAGLQPGDVAVAINGKPIRFWHDSLAMINASHDKEIELTYERDGERHTVRLTPEPTTSTDTMGLTRNTRGRIGIGLGTAGTVVALKDLDGPAARAGVQFFDQILAIDQKPVKRFDEILSAVRQSDGQPLELLIARPRSLDVDYGSLYTQVPQRITVTPEETDGKYSIGIDTAQSYLAKIEPDGPAAKAGLKPGDKIVKLDGRAFANIVMVTERIQNTLNERLAQRDASRDQEVRNTPIEAHFELEIRRGDQILTVDYEPQIIDYADQTDQTHYRIDYGWDHFQDSVLPDKIHHPLMPRIAHSFSNSVRDTWDFAKLVTVGIWRMVQGRISLKSVGGPIMIGELAAEAGQAGIDEFLRMMALISINLAVINMLPIPILDGGRLVFYALEAIKRGPLSYRTRQLAAYIGLVFIIFLMVLAFKNDIERNWYRVVEYFESE